MINETDYNNNPLTKEQENQIDALFMEFDNSDAPGYAVGVIQDDRFIYKKSYGMANLEYDIPITADSKFDIGSVSKQFTAAGIALLVLEGKLSFDDDVRKYFPEMPDYGTTITIRHLLHHTSGISDYTSLMTLAKIDLYDHHDLKRMIFRQKKLNFTPGSKFQYSNSGYLLLAEIISQVSGIFFGDYVQEKIFKPLGMHNSLIEESIERIIKNRVVSYYYEDGEFWKCVDTRDHYGARGVISTINDLLLWDQNFYSGKLGGKEFVEMLTTTKANFEWNDYNMTDIDSHSINQDKLGYALGLAIYKYKNLVVNEHTGGWLGFRSHMMRFPEQRTTVLVLCNNENMGFIGEQIADIVLTDEIAKFSTLPEGFNLPENNNKTLPESINLNENELEKFCGHYWCEKDMLKRKICLRDGNLFYWRNEKSESKLIPTSQNELIMASQKDDIKLIFEFNGDQTSFNFLTNGKCTSAFKSFEPLDCTSEYLNKFIGNYCSEELDVTYQVRNESDKLVVFIKDKKFQELDDIIKDVFLIAEWNSSVKFYCNDKKEITGFILNEERTNDTVFVKLY